MCNGNDINYVHSTASILPLNWQQLWRFHFYPPSAIKLPPWKISTKRKFFLHKKVGENEKRKRKRRVVWWLRIRPIESNPNLHSDLVHDPLPHQCHTTAAVSCVSPAVSCCLSTSLCCLSAVFWKLKITRVGALGWCIRITATGIKVIIPSSLNYDRLTGLIQKHTRKFESSQKDVHR